MTRIVLAGAKGRMGTALMRCAAQLPELEVVGQLDSKGDLRNVIEKTDVVIDFTSTHSSVSLAQICAAHKKAMVVGTTGHGDAERKDLMALSAQIAMVWSSNFSTGVNILFWLTRKTAEIAGANYDLEIVEMHHRLKKDAPSGTAETLVKILQEVRGNQLLERHGREGLTGERTSSEIGIHSIRGGDVTGDHTVIFAGSGERLELTHKASNRDTFANGALRAAQWVVGKPPGIYDMQNVLGLR